MNKRLRKKKKTLSIKTIRKMKLDKDDTLVIECSDLITVEKQSHMQQSISKMFPNNNVMVLPKGYVAKIIN